MLKGKKAAIHNLGCKVNAYEAEAVEKILSDAGAEIVPFTGKADIYIVNTCSVTNIADRKSRQMLHRAKKLNPDSVVVAMGCYSQINGRAALDDADLLIGTSNRAELPRLIGEYMKDQAGNYFVGNVPGKDEYEELPGGSVKSRSRAFIKIQDGCDAFCSYCIIPYARGRSRSRDITDIIGEARMLAAEGHREIVLTGIHLSDYSFGGTDLGGLVLRLDEIAGLDRIRLGSLDPQTITEGFIKDISRSEKLCPHFHISLQSGCDSVLKRMNRKYTCAEYEEKCLMVRETWERPALTTDIITGFPGETEEEFAATVEFTERISFFETHIFPYSRREGTKAASEPFQITEKVKKQRAGVLIELGRKKREEYLKDSIGSPCVFLPEEEVTIDGRAYMLGHTSRYEEAAAHGCVPGEDGLITFIPERIYEGHILI